MKHIIQFLVFIAYTILVFFITDYRILAILGCIQILIMLTLRINLAKATKNIVSISIFIVFTMLVNALIGTIQEAILVGIRLVLICNTTYIFSKLMTTLQVARVIQSLATPIKCIGGNPETIGLIISIAMAFVPIIRQELIQIRYALKAKGFDTRMVHLMLHLNVIMAPLFISLLQRVNEMEYALKAKAYTE